MLHHFWGIYPIVFNWQNLCTLIFRRLSQFQIANNSPKNGCFYYFQPDGAQVRTNRPFSIGEDKDVHDDKPTTSNCNKIYPTIAKKGASFRFLWFCPDHGHCYGAHIVNGKEGRKDAACSLFTHLTKSPDAIFYDFGCSLEEYCLNREAEFFKCTRFYHDLFHGFSHSCSCMYSSMGLEGMSNLNTSICEQFNSFLQNICRRHISFFICNLW